MKKFIIIMLTVITLLASLTVFASAKMFTPPTSTNECLAFAENKIAYPFYKNFTVANGQECLYPTLFAVYDTNSIELRSVYNGTTNGMLIKASRQNNMIEFFYTGTADGEEQLIYSGAGYDILLYGMNGSMYYAIVDSSYKFMRTAVLGDSTIYPLTNWLLTVSYAEELGYTLGYGTNPPAIEPGHIDDVIFDGLFPFVVGIGSTFAYAFSSVFFVNGTLNALAIFLLVMFGVVLGYGVIRWITGKFRKESN